MRILVACVLVSVALACQSQEERVSEYRARADSYLEDEQWAEAKIELLNLIQIDPEDAEAHFHLGEALLELKEYGDALWQYRESVRLDPEQIDWRVELASLEMLARQTDDAREQVDFILEKQPEHVGALLLRARLRGQAAEYDLMLADVDFVLELEPDHEFALIIRARTMAAMRRPEETASALVRLIEAHPKVASHSLKAGYLISQGRQDEAEQAYGDALAVAETVEQRKGIHLALANLHMTQNNLEDAERELLAAREGSEEDETLQAALARFYVISNKPERAVALLEERVASSPDDPAPLVALARFQRALGNRDEALAAVMRALEAQPDDENARVLRVDFLIEDSREKPELRVEAQQILDEVLEDNPASVRAQFTMAKIMLLDGQYEDSSILLRRVIEEQPETNSYFLLGTAYLAMGQEELARAEFLSALQQDPTNLSARRQLAALYLQSENPELAVQEARRGLSTNATNPHLNLILAEALVQLRDAEEAGQTLDAMALLEDVVPLSLRLRAAEIYLDLARFDDARKVVAAVLAQHPGNHGALRSTIIVEARSGQPGAALPVLNAAIAASPDEPQLYRLRGSYYLGFRRPSDGALRFSNEAQADLLQAEQLDPESDRTQILLGRLRGRMGNQRQALEAFDKAIALNPANGDAYMRKGAILEAQGRLDAAVLNYRALLERPDRGGVGRRALAVAMNNLAWLLADGENPGQQELDRALELAQDAKELLPNDPNVADTLGWVMYKRAIPGAAISLFREAIGGYEPGSAPRATTRYHLALSYEANGDTGRAIEELEASLKEAESFPGREEAVAALRRLEAS